MVAFAGRPYLVGPLTLDHDWLASRTSIASDRARRGRHRRRTPRSPRAANRLKEKEAKTKIVVLLTDGENNAGKVPPLTAAEAAESARDPGLHDRRRDARRGALPRSDPFGSDGLSQRSDGVTRRRCAQIAELTDGDVLPRDRHALARRDLEEIDQLERTASRRSRRYLGLPGALFPTGSSAAGLVLLGMEVLLAKRDGTLAVTFVRARVLPGLCLSSPRSCRRSGCVWRSGAPPWCERFVAPRRSAHLPGAASTTAQREGRAGSCAAFACSRLLWHGRGTDSSREVKQRGRDLIVALDTSRSMLAHRREAEPPRARQARRARSAAPAGRRPRRPGGVRRDRLPPGPLTLDYPPCSHNAGRTRRRSSRAAAPISPPRSTPPSTPSKGRGQTTALVILTDGEDHGSDLDDAIKRATERGVKLYTVGIGTSKAS